MQEILSTTNTISSKSSIAWSAIKKKKTTPPSPHLTRTTTIRIEFEIHTGHHEASKTTE